MIRALNWIMPRTKLVPRPTEDNNEVLDNFRCRRMVEQVIKEHLPDTKAVCIIWVDKDDFVSSAYCNISPWDRLWLLFVAWLQEAFDIRIRHREDNENGTTKA